MGAEVCQERVTPLVKRAWVREEDAQAFASITAQSLVHVPFVRSCHWGPHVCARPLELILNLIRLTYLPGCRDYSSDRSQAPALEAPARPSSRVSEIV